MEVHLDLLTEIFKRQSCRRIHTSKTVGIYVITKFNYDFGKNFAFPNVTQNMAATIKS